MNLPVYHRLADKKLHGVDELKFALVGAKQKLVAVFETYVGVRHTWFTGQPHPVGMIFPEGSTTTFELRKDMQIYVCCDQNFQCESGFPVKKNLRGSQNSSKTLRKDL